MSDYQNLRDEVESLEKELRIQEKEIEKLKMTIYGIDGQNGLRGQVKNIENILEEFKKYLPHLQGFEEVKKNLVRIFWVLLLSGLMALGSRYVSVKIGEKNTEILKKVQDVVEQQASEHE